MAEVILNGLTVGELNKIYPIASNANFGGVGSLQPTTLEAEPTTFRYAELERSQTLRTVEGTGIGLTYDENGRLTGGIITQISYSESHPLVGTQSVTLTNVNQPAENVIVADLADVYPTFEDLDVVVDPQPGAPVFGTEGDDILFGNPEANVLIGLGGNDTIISYEADDVLLGNEGDDSLDSGSGNDQLFGGFGNDQLFGGAGNDVLFGEDGNDLLVGDADGTAGEDTLFGGNGSDTAFAGAGNDYVEGGAGADVLYGEDGNDTMLGGLDNDVMFGGAGVDVVLGEAGDDALFGEGGEDYLNGGAGNDSLDGGADNDFLEGGEGNDLLFGAEGDDVLFGGAGNDLLAGGDGSDYMVASAGIDVIQGGNGVDVFKLEGGSGQNFWSDFEDGVDKIDVSFLSLTETTFNQIVSQVTDPATGTNTTLLTVLDTQLYLEGVDAASIDASDFIFAEEEPEIV